MYLNQYNFFHDSLNNKVFKFIFLWVTVESNEKYIDLHFLYNNMWQLQSITRSKQKAFRLKCI